MVDKPQIPHIREYHLEQDDLNKELEKFVKDEIKRTSGLDYSHQHSNIGGWHSDRDLHLHLKEEGIPGILLVKLFESFSNPMNRFIKAHPTDYGTTAKPHYEWDYSGSWFNVAFNGSYNAPHIHPGDQISGAYYVRTEEPSKEFPFSGRIDFIHNKTQYGFFPKPGTLILFPSDTLHWVHPYYGSELRICLSFNVNNIR